MRQTINIILLITLTALIVPDYNYAQTNINKDLKLNIGSTLCLSARDISFPAYSGYIAPSLQLGKHEIYLGCLVNERTEGKKFKPSLGGIAGYKFYVGKNPGAIQFYLNYSLILQRYLYVEDYTIYWGPNYPNGYDINYISKERFYNNVFGYGLNFYLTKKKNIYFYQTTGYSIVRYIDKGYKNGSLASIHKDFFWDQIMFTAGLTCKLTSIKSKTKTE